MDGWCISNNNNNNECSLILVAVGEQGIVKQNNFAEGGGEDSDRQV